CDPPSPNGGASMNVLNVVPMSSVPPPPDSTRTAHASVMLDEVVLALGVRPSHVIVDATLGAGGHTEALLERTEGRVIGVDRDTTALALAGRRLARFGDRVRFVHGRFGELPQLLAAEGLPHVDGILADV